MLTRRGWGVAAITALLAVAGRVFGVFELFVLAAGAAGLLVAGAVTVLLRTVELDASRQLRPARVHAGGNSRVELAVANRGRRRSPVLTVRDSVAPSSDSARAPGGDDPPRRARFLLAPLAPDEEDTASYRLPADGRGTYSVGPLEAQVGDAFALWSRAVTIAPAVALTVYPAVEAVVALPHTRGEDPTAGAPRPAAIGPTGEEFYGLRAYQVGDDLRRVHWPSTARTGELVVRQLEQPWQGRATVLLDVRAAVHSETTFELGVSAAASILLASWRAGALVRLATTDGTDSGFSAGHPHFEAVMEHLAVVGPRREDAMASVIAGLRRVGNVGALAVVTTSAAAADLEHLAGLQARFDSLTILVVERSSRDPASPSGAGRRRGGAAVVRVPADGRFATAWNHAVGGSVLTPAGGGWR